MTDMPGKVDGTGKIRAQLECAILALVDMQEAMPFVRQRIEQTIRRTGMTELLSPALDDLDRMAQDAAEAKADVGAAISVLMGKR
jgi:hypothetical protein